MVDLLLLNLSGEDGLCLLDTGQDPGLALVSPVGAHPETHLLRVGVRLVISGQLEHLYWGSSGHVTEPAIGAGAKMFTELSRTFLEKLICLPTLRQMSVCWPYPWSA